MADKSGLTSTGTILIRGARQLLTLRGSSGPRYGAALNDLGLIQDGALLIKNGVLAEVGPTRRVENLAEARKAREINAAGRVVMPGFVDSHTHLTFPPPGAPDDLADAARLINATNGQRLTARARDHLHTMARHGTTTVEMKTGCGPDQSAEMKLLRVLAALKQDPLDVIPTFLFRLTPEQESSGLADWAFRDLLPKLRRRRLARFIDVAWEIAGDGSPVYRQCLETARSLRFACKVHADRQAPTAAITCAVEHFAATVDHLEHAAPADAALLAGSCTIATLLPCASFQSGGAEAPARALIESGAPVALASNFNPRHSPMPNMQTVIALACLRMGLTPAEAISAATINGAHALGTADRTGSLEPGKPADVVILNTPDYRELGRHFGQNLVYMTIKRGEFIYKEGEVARPEDRFLPRPAESPDAPLLRN